MLLNIAELSEILASIADVSATLSGDTRTIGAWRASYKEDLATARQQPGIAIFNSFVNNLLERASSGEAWTRRYEMIMNSFLSFDDVYEQNALGVLKKSSYRFPNSGTKVIMEAKKIICEPGFSWETYYQDAEEHYETDFQSDRFLAIKDVGYKTRDLALSEFSDRFVANRGQIVDTHCFLHL